MLKAIIVDDEQHCIDHLTALLQKHRDFIELTGASKSLEEAAAFLKQHQVDVVFLDIHLGSQSGFELLKDRTQLDFEVIFTTAFDQYAVEAFRWSALDYLLKPVVAEEFESSIVRLKDRRDLADMTRKIEVLFHNFESKLSPSKKIAIPTLEGLVFLNTHEILRCQSSGNYTDFFIKPSARVTATKTLKYFEGLLGEANFFRVHKSHLVNLSYVEKYIKGKGGYVLMTDGTPIEVAVRRKEEFLKKLTA